MAWVGLFLAPAAFLTHLEVGYLMVLWVCGDGRSPLWLHALAAVFALISAGGVLAAWRVWRREGSESPGEAGTAAANTRMLALVGMGVGSVTTLILLAQLLAGFVTPICQ